MSEVPKSTEERRLGYLLSALDKGRRVYYETKYGTCMVRNNYPENHITLTIVKGLADEPQMMFFIDSSSGEIIAQTEAGDIRVWKDEDQNIPLTPEDIIDEFPRY